MIKHEYVVKSVRCPSEALAAVLSGLKIPIDAMFGWPGPSGTSTVLSAVFGHYDQERDEHKVAIQYSSFNPEEKT